MKKTVKDIPIAAEFTTKKKGWERLKEIWNQEDNDIDNDDFYENDDIPIGVLETTIFNLAISLLKKSYPELFQKETTKVYSKFHHWGELTLIGNFNKIKKKKFYMIFTINGKRQLFTIVLKHCSDRKIKKMSKKFNKKAGHIIKSEIEIK